MKTLVFQAWVGPRPRFLDACLDSVRGWAHGSGYDYRLEGEALLAGVPPWFRERVKEAIVPMSNVGRLELCRTFLREGWDRVIWVDADVVMFAPDQLPLRNAGDYLLTREVWAAAEPDGSARYIQNVTCSFLMFDRGSVFLEFFLHALLARVADKAPETHVGTATQFLTALSRVLPLKCTRRMGQFSPLLLADLATPAPRLVPEFMRRIGGTLAGANLGTAFWGGRIDLPDLRLALDDALFQKAIDLLLSTRGAVLNRHAPATTTP